MNKSFKIFLIVLALVSVGFSLSILFNWNPFLKKEKGTLPEEGLIQPSPTPRELIDIKSTVVSLPEASFFSSPVEEEYFDNLYAVSLDGSVSDENEEKLFLAFFLEPGTEIKAIFKGSVFDIDEFKHGGHPSFLGEPDFTQIWIEKENGAFKASYIFIGETLVEKGEIFEEGTVLAKAEEGALNSRGGANLSLSIINGNGETVGLSKDLFEFTE